MLGPVYSALERVRSFLRGIGWLPRVLRLAALIAGLLTIVQMNLPWMQVKFTNAVHSGDGYDWTAGEVGNGAEVLLFGLLLLVLVLLGNWRGEFTCAFAMLLGFFIAFETGRQLVHLRDFVDHANLVTAPKYPGSGYVVGPGPYAAMAAGLIAIAVGVIGSLASEPVRPDRTGEPIYHLVEESEFRACVGRGVYHPGSLDRDGFVHCSFRESVLTVANDYFSRPNSPVLLLEILPDAVEADTKYEAAAPLPGAGATHLHTGPLFPHVYGPIELEAIEGIGVLGRSPDGYSWPEEFFPYEVILG